MFKWCLLVKAHSKSLLMTKLILYLIISQSKMVPVSLPVGSVNRVKHVAIPGSRVTYRYGTRGRNQRQGGSGRRVPPSPANT